MSEPSTGQIVSTEREGAERLANFMLDRPGADPDDDLCVLSRQFLRALEALRDLQAERADVIGWLDDEFYDLGQEVERGKLAETLKGLFPRILPESPTGSSIS